MSEELFQAVHDNDREKVERLISANRAVAVARNQTGVSALMQARYEGRREIVEVLRREVGDLDVFEAATLGDVPQLRKLLAADPALAKAYSADGFTALHLSAFFAQPETAAELLRQGADPKAVAKNSMKVAVINSAAASGRADLVKMILQAGADPNARQQMGYTALHAAAAHDNVEMAQALMDAGADPSLKSDDGGTAAEKAGPAVAAVLKAGAKGKSEFASA
jgi:ankyrin repeat protein